MHLERTLSLVATASLIALAACGSSSSPAQGSAGADGTAGAAGAGGAAMDNAGGASGASSGASGAGGGASQEDASVPESGTNASEAGVDAAPQNLVDAPVTEGICNVNLDGKDVTFTAVARGVVTETMGTSSLAFFCADRPGIALMGMEVNFNDTTGAPIKTGTYDCGYTTNPNLRLSWTEQGLLGAYLGACTVTLSEIGANGGRMKGTFSAMLNGAKQPTDGKMHTLTNGTFDVKRVN